VKYTLYFEGEFLVRDDHFLETLTPGIFEARGIFETMRVDNGRVVLLDRHLQRLRQGARILRLRLPQTTKELQGIVQRVVMFNQFKSGRARIMLFQKDHSSIELAVMIMPRTVFTEQDYFHGYNVTTTRCAIPSTSRYALVKSLDYGRYYQAYQAARSKGFNETLLINAKGLIVEASRSNVFFIKDEVIYTPSLTLGCLDGITRRMVIECARDFKLPVKAVNPKMPDVLSCDEAFLTNALIGVMPITRVDGKIIESGRVGDWTYKIRSQYLKKTAALAKLPAPRPVAV
jgi:branched-subunit amino acid aminotransferase/4-amino-4-deoxychorismate lyase